MTAAQNTSAAQNKGRSVARRRVGVLISGRGSNMQALVRAAEAADYPAEIAVVISNRPDAKGLDWARSQGLPAVVVDHKQFPDRASFERQLDETLHAHGVQLVALAGFMRLMTAEIVTRWQGAMINIHPSLLPSFTGLNTHQRAIEAGVKIAGCTVHFVTPEMDEGPIVAQAAVPVLPSDTEDTLADRILTVEHQLYAQALSWVASGQVTYETARTARYGGIDHNSSYMVPGPV